MYYELVDPSSKVEVVEWKDIPSSTDKDNPSSFETTCVKYINKTKEFAITLTLYHTTGKICVQGPSIQAWLDTHYAKIKTRYHSKQETSMVDENQHKSIEIYVCENFDKVVNELISNSAKDNDINDTEHKIKKDLIDEQLLLTNEDSKSIEINKVRSSACTTSSPF